MSFEFFSLMKHNQTLGFTLIELLVVVAVLGILAGGILIALNIGGTLGKANITKAKRFAASLENGLVISQVGNWSFEDGSADTAKDTSGYGNNGNLAGATLCPGGTACPTWKTATDCDLGFGGCLSFDGTDDYVEILNSLPTNFGAGDFTLSAWINTTTTGSSKSIIETGVFGLMKSLRINHTSSGELAFFVLGDAGGNQLEVNVNINDGSWHHVVGVRNGSNIKLYKDSVLVDSDNWDAGDTDTGAVWLVAKNFFGSSYTSGLIDEVQIYKEALTLSQIQKLYAQGVISRALAYR